MALNRQSSEAPLTLERLREVLPHYTEDDAESLFNVLTLHEGQNWWSDAETFHHVLNQFFSIIYSYPDKISENFKLIEFNQFYLKHICVYHHSLIKPYDKNDFSTLNFDANLAHNRGMISIMRLHLIALRWAYLYKDLKEHPHPSWYPEGNSIKEILINHNLFNEYDLLCTQYKYFISDPNNSEMQLFPYTVLSSHFACALMCTAIAVTPQIFFLDNGKAEILKKITDSCKKLLLTLEAPPLDEQFEKQIEALNNIVNFQYNHLIQTWEEIKTLKNYQQKLITFVQGELLRLHQLSEKSAFNNLKEKKSSLENCRDILQSPAQFSLQSFLVDVSVIKNDDVAHLFSTVVSKLKESCNQHSDTGVIGFFKLTWARTPTSKTHLQTFLEKNPVPECIQRYITMEENIKKYVAKF